MDGFYPLTGLEKAKRIKKVPENIEELLTLRSVAYGYCDDGKRKPNTWGFYFCTDGFTKEDVQRLASVLEKKFNVHTSVRAPSWKKPHQTRIYIHSRAKRGENFVLAEQFVRQFEVYVIPEMRYKLPFYGIKIM